MVLKETESNTRFSFINISWPSLLCLTNFSWPVSFWYQFNAQFVLSIQQAPPILNILLWIPYSWKVDRQIKLIWYCFYKLRVMLTAPSVSYMRGLETKKFWCGLGEETALSNFSLLCNRKQGGSFHLLASDRHNGRVQECTVLFKSYTSIYIIIQSICPIIQSLNCWPLQDIFWTAEMNII